LENAVRVHAKSILIVFVSKLGLLAKTKKSGASVSLFFVLLKWGSFEILHLNAYGQAKVLNLSAKLALQLRQNKKP
jgi:hypothetical protein